MQTFKKPRLPLFLAPVLAKSSISTIQSSSNTKLSTCPFRGSPVCLHQRRVDVSNFCVTLLRNRFRHISTSLQISAAADAIESLVLDTQVPVQCGAETAEVALRVENLGGRRRRVSGGVDIDKSAQRVWDVLTRYECNELYMPNITKSEVERSRSGDIFLEQIGVISNKLGLKTRIVMRVKEDFGNFCITFSKVEGRDFSEFEGGYQLQEISPDKVRLEYEITAIPMPLFPVSLVERKITKEVPGMLASVRQEAMQGNFVPFI